MSKTITIITESIFQNSKVNKENKIIKDVVILGRKSKNNREYSNRAFQDAIKLFEDSPAYFEHETKKKVKDLIGQFKNVKENNNYIKADLHVLENQNWLLDMAERMPTLAGFSINASGNVKNENGKEIVESLTNRVSIDLVTQPATVKNLFEEVNLEEEKMSEEIKKIQEEYKKLESENKEIQEKLDISRGNYVEYKEKFVMLEAENKKLKEKVEKEEKEKKQNELIDKKLKEAKLERKDLSATLLEVFQESDEKRIDKLIEDITKIQKGKISFGERRNLSEEKNKNDDDEIKKNIRESIGG